MNIAYNTSIGYQLLRDSLTYNISVETYLKTTFDAYLDEDEYIVFEDPRLYTMFILKYTC